MRWPLPLACLLALLPACSASTRSVEVRNDSRRNVTVSLERDQLGGDPIVMARASLNARSTTTLGPVSPPPFETTYLRVARPGQLGDLGAQVELPRGHSTAVIEDAGVDSWGSVNVHLLSATELDD